MHFDLGIVDNSCVKVQGQWQVNLNFLKLHSEFKNPQLITIDGNDTYPLTLVFDFEKTNEYGGKLRFILIDGDLKEEPEQYYNILFHGYGYGPGGDHGIRHIWFGNIEGDPINTNDGYMFYPHMEQMISAFTILKDLEIEFLGGRL